MKVKQLINKLSKLDQESEVILSSDSEGNNYCVLNEIHNPFGLRFFKYDGEIQMLDKEEVKRGDYTESQYKKAKPCVILYLD